MDIRKTVGRNVIRLRSKHGLSQLDLCFGSGLAQSRVSGIENGVDNPTILTLLKLAIAFGEPPAELVILNEADKEGFALLKPARG